MTMSWRREKPSRFSERSATSLLGGGGWKECELDIYACKFAKKLPVLLPSLLPYPNP